MNTVNSAGVPHRDSAREHSAARVWRGMRALVLELHSPRQQVSEALGMSFVRSKALRRLAAGPMTMRELSEALSTDRPYTTLVADDLVRRGLVERSVHPTDRRQRIVTATEAGLAAAALADSILDTPPEVITALDSRDLDALDRIVARLLAASDPQAPEDARRPPRADGDPKTAVD